MPIIDRRFVTILTACGIALPAVALAVGPKPGAGYAAPLIGHDTPADEDVELRQRPATSIILGGQTITLEKTTLAEVQARFGGQIQRHGEAGEAQNWLCYAVEGSPDWPAQYVWVVSDSEMGGPEGHVTMIGAEVNTVLDRADCTRAKSGAMDLVIGAPGLTTTDADLVSHFGSAPRDAADTVTYSYIANENGADIGQSLTYRLVDNRIVAFVVDQITTY